jgi:putative transcriptional regulator
VEKYEGDIKTLRKKLGWTRQRFAREVGISSATVNRWEHGKTTPSNLGLIRVARLVKQIAIFSKEGGQNE